MSQHLQHYGWRLLSGTITAAAIALLLKLAAFQSLEQIAYRHFFQARDSVTHAIRALEQDRKEQRLRSEEKAVHERTMIAAALPPSSSYPLTPVDTSPTKIIALTASVFEVTETAAVTISYDDFLRKPIQENILLAKLAEVLGVRYLYEDSKQQERTWSDLAITASMPDLHDHLMQMPPGWAEQLHWAAVKGSDRTILQLVKQIPKRNALLTQTLTYWLNNFQFDEIINLTQPFFS